MIEEVEARHIAVEEAAERFEATRKRTFFIGGACAGAHHPGRAPRPAPPGSCSWPSPSSPVGASLLARANVGRAARAEEKALEDAGAHSYLGFQLQRVNGLLANDANRKALMDVAGARRAALAEWQQLAGDIPVEWALANREEIEEAARLRREVDALGALSATAPECREDVTGDLAHVLVTRLAEVRSAGGEGVPLLLDDPFRELDRVGEAAAARAPRPLGRRAADRVPHRGRGRGVVGPPRGAHRRGRPHRAGARARRGAPRRTSPSASDRQLVAATSPLGCRRWSCGWRRSTTPSPSGRSTTSRSPPRRRPSTSCRARWRTSGRGSRSGPAPAPCWWRSSTATVCGFGSLSPWRDRPAYATTVEDSVYVHRDHQGQGVGAALLTELVATATAHGFHACMARIVGGHDASIAAPPAVRLRGGGHRAGGGPQVRQVARRRAHGEAADVTRPTRSRGSRPAPSASRSARRATSPSPPDGSRVAFLRAAGPEDALTSLWVLDVASGAERVVADPARAAGRRSHRPAARGAGPARAGARERGRDHRLRHRRRASRRGGRAGRAAGRRRPRGRHRRDRAGARAR